MRPLRAWIARIGGMLQARRRAGEFEQELRAHLELHIDEHQRNGTSPDEARRIALLALGGIAPTREMRRDRSGVPWLHDLLQDVRYSVRMLRRDPVFSVLSVVILAAGVAALTSMVSFMNQVYSAAAPPVDLSRRVRVSPWRVLFSLTG